MASFRSAPAHHGGEPAMIFWNGMGGAASAVGVANPPWPCTAGGRHISKPRLRQGQLPNGRYRPRGISGLTHRAAPPALYLGRLEARRNGLDACRKVVDAG